MAGVAMYSGTTQWATIVDASNILKFSSLLEISNM